MGLRGADDADPPMRTRARIDATHREIVDALEAAGCFVQSLASVGKGCPDLLVSFCGRWFVLEAKSGKGRLNPAQVEWTQKAGALVYVLRGVEDVELFIHAQGEF